MIRSSDLETAGPKEIPRFPSREEDRILVEFAPAHDEPCRGTPRVVIPEREEPARNEKAPELADDAGPPGGLNVMKNTAAVNGVERLAALELRGKRKTDPGSPPFLPRHVDDRGRLVHADDTIRAQQLRQQRRRGSVSASKIEHRSRELPAATEALAEPLDPATSEIFPALSRDAETLMDELVIVLRVPIERGSPRPVFAIDFP